MKMKAMKLLCMVLALMLLCVTVVADGWNAELEIEVKSAMEKALGDAADAVESVLEDHSFALMADDGVLCLQVDDSVLKMDDKAAVVADFVLHMDTAHASFMNELQQLLEVTTADVAEREDIYNSLFTQSRFMELPREKTEELLNMGFAKALFLAAGCDAEALMSGMEKNYSGELSYFKADEAYLLKLDVTAGENDMLILMVKDASGVSASLYIDSDVKDWDEVIAAVDDEEFETTRGVRAFVLNFNDDGTKETYLEVTPISKDTMVTYEVSQILDAKDASACEIEMVVRVDGKKYLEMDADGSFGENAAVQTVDFENMDTVLDAETANAVRTVYGVLIK